MISRNNTQLIVTNRLTM